MCNERRSKVKDGGSENSRKFDIFIEGEIVDLCVPSNESWVIDQWYRWFNDEKITAYLDQGVFPNTVEKQKEFYEMLLAGNERIALLIRPKSENYFSGVVSLSFIDFKTRQCDLSMVIGEIRSPSSLLYGMEAKCRMTEHAFEKLGVERINTGQVVDLIKWQRLHVLLGYQIEGIARKKFRKGYKVWDVMMSSCLLEDYLKLKEMRNGSLWPGKQKMFEMIKNLPEESPIDRLQEWLHREREESWKKM